MSKVGKGNLHDSSDFSSKEPAEDIECKDCIFKDDGTVYSNDYRKGNCMQFPFPSMKPMGVLLKSRKCPKYKPSDLQ